MSWNVAHIHFVRSPSPSEWCSATPNSTSVPKTPSVSRIKNSIFLNCPNFPQHPFPMKSNLVPQQSLQTIPPNIHPGTRGPGTPSQQHLTFIPNVLLGPTYPAHFTASPAKPRRCPKRFGRAANSSWASPRRGPRSKSWHPHARWRAQRASPGFENRSTHQIGCSLNRLVGEVSCFLV